MQAGSNLPASVSPPYLGPLFGPTAPARPMFIWALGGGGAGRYANSGVAPNATREKIILAPAPTRVPATRGRPLKTRGAQKSYRPGFA